MLGIAVTSHTAVPPEPGIESNAAEEHASGLLHKKNLKFFRQITTTHFHPILHLLTLFYNAWFKSELKRRWGLQMMQPAWITKGSNGFLLAIGLILAGCGGSEGEKPAPEPAKQYAVQLSVTNLQGSLALQLNGQSSLTVSKDGTYTFDKQLTSGTSYAVAVTTQPSYQQCTVSAGTGTIQSANVTNVTVACADQVQMTELSTYYPASIVEFTVPVTNTDLLSVTYNDMPLKVEQGLSSTRYVSLPNNASGNSELAYSVGTLSRKKSITVQPLTLPTDTKSYVETQYQALLAGLQQERDKAVDPAILDTLLAELKTNQSQISAMNTEQLTRLTLVMMQLVDTPVLSNKSFDTEFSAVPEACEQFTTPIYAEFYGIKYCYGCFCRDSDNWRRGGKSACARHIWYWLLQNVRHGGHTI